MKFAEKLNKLVWLCFNINIVVIIFVGAILGMYVNSFLFVLGIVLLLFLISIFIWGGLGTLTEIGLESMRTNELLEHLVNTSEIAITDIHNLKEDVDTIKYRQAQQS